MIASIPIVWRPMPMAGRPHVHHLPAGLSLAEMVAAVPDLPADFRATAVICLDGEQVPRELWPRLRVRPDARRAPVITLHRALRGGAGGKGALAIVATIAAAVIAPYAAPWALAGFSAATGVIIPMGAYATAVTLTTAAITLGAALGASALAAAPSLERAGASPFALGAAEEVGAGGTASLSGNVLAPGASPPRVIGTHRLHPPLGCHILVETVDEDEIAEVVMVLNGPHALSELRAGNIDADDIEELDYELCDGLPASPIQSLVTRQGFTHAAGIELSGPRADLTTQVNLAHQNEPESDLPRWHAFVSRVAPDEIWINLAWPQGLFVSDAPAAGTLEAVRLRFRARGETTWINAPEIVFHHNRVGSISKTIRLIWGAMPAAPSFPPTGFGPLYAYKSVPQQTVGPTRGGWTADAYFSKGAGSDLLALSTFYSSKVANTELRSDRAILWLDEATFPKGIYEVEIMRSCVILSSAFTAASYTISGVVYDLFGYYTSSLVHRVVTDQSKYLGRLGVNRFSSIWNENPIATRDFATVSVRVKNRALDQISVLASGYVADLAGGAWETITTTSNPAPHLRDVLGGRLSADPLPLDLIDDDAASDQSLRELRQHAIDGGFACNLVAENKSARDVAAAIAGSARARLRQSEKFGVIIDRDRGAETPVQVFTPRNMADMRCERAFVRLPHGLRTRFSDAADDYREREIIVMDPLAEALPSSLRLEDRRYDGLTSEAAAETQALFELAQGRHRLVFYHGTAGHDAIVCRRGDLVALQHHVITARARAARVAAVIRDGANVAGLLLDAGVMLARDDAWASREAAWSSYASAWTGAASGIAIRCRDGSVLVKEIRADVGEPRTVWFAVPFADPGTSVLDEDCLVAAGPLGEEYSRVIVFEMTFEPDRARLTFVPEAPELFS